MYLLQRVRRRKAQVSCKICYFHTANQWLLHIFSCFIPFSYCYSRYLDKNRAEEGSPNLLPGMSDYHLLMDRWLLNCLAKIIGLSWHQGKAVSQNLKLVISGFPVRSQELGEGLKHVYILRGKMAEFNQYLTFFRKARFITEEDLK